MSHLPESQIPGIYHRRIGDMLVTALSDGYLDSTLDVIQVLERDEAAAMLMQAFRPSPPRISVNAFLVRSGRRTALIETGSGDTMGPTLGWLFRNLSAAGVSPDEIDTVLLTHMHPDHSNGLRRPDGSAYFPNAEIAVHENELSHWWDDGRMAQATERQRVRYFEGARHQIVPYRDQLKPFRQGEVFPGITAIPAHGHTPGHSTFLIESAGQSLLIWGDTVHVPELQVPRPEVTVDFDSDPAAAVEARRKVFDMVASERMLVGGMHLHFPGFSHLVRTATGYAVAPEPWSQVL